MRRVLEVGMGWIFLANTGLNRVQERAAANAATAIGKAPAAASERPGIQGRSPCYFQC